MPASVSGRIASSGMFRSGDEHDSLGRRSERAGRGDALLNALNVEAIDAVARGMRHSSADPTCSDMEFWRVSSAWDKE